MLLALALAIAPGPVVLAQLSEFAPVAVDDSPVAERMLAEVAAQSVDNPERAATLLAELLDQYADRVVIRRDDPDEFESVRRAVLRALSEDGAIRDAWRERFEVEASRILVEQGPDAALRRRPVTEAGLEAGLRVAQRAIESGDPEVGRRALVELADWPGAIASEVADRRELLEALAWIAIASREDRQAVRESRDAAIELVSRRDRKLAERLAAIAVLNTPSSDGLSVASPFDRDWTSLWEIPLETSLLRQRTVDPTTGRNIFSDPEGLRRGGRLLVSVAAVDGDLVIVNEGRLLQGVDRYTGRLRWWRDHGVGRSLSGSGTPGDLCEVVLGDGDAYTITGYGMPGDRGGERSIIRFDPGTGIERWEVRPDRLADQPELEDASPCGPPLVLGDLVVVPLRRTTPRLETIDLVLALDRADGAIRWVRTIASSGSSRSGNFRPPFRLAASEGDVFAACPAGAVARLDGRTGEVIWLRREEVPLRVDGRSPYPWQIGGAVAIDRGIATIDAARRHWQLLDPSTGQVLLKRSIGVGTAAGAAVWLAVAEGAGEAGGDLLLAIGDDVVAIDPARPDERVWSWASRREPEADPADASDRLVRGRVFVTAKVLLVPTSEGVFAVDPRDGRSEMVLELDAPVNPVLAADSIHATGPDSLVTAMPVLDAVATLERRLRNQPDAVPQAIALVELAGRIGRSDLLRFAANVAVDGLSAPGGDAWRGEVLDLLLDLVPSATDEDGLQLLDLAGRTAVDVVGRTRLRLAKASWLETRGRMREAAEAWLGVMGDAEASVVMVREGDALEVSAGSVARRRLVEASGRDPILRARLEADGRVEVERAIASRETAAVLVELARRRPGSDAAFDAASRAIEILRDEGDPAAVHAVGLVVARDFLATDPRRISLLESAAVVCDDAGESGRAAALRRAGGGPSSVVASPPRLQGVPDHIDLLDGRLAFVDPRIEDEAASGLVLLFDTNTEELIARDAGADLPERWRRRIDGDHLIVGWTPELLVWEGVKRREPVLTALDPGTGEVLWSTPQPSQVLPPLSRFSVQADGSLPGGDMFLPNQVLPLSLEEGTLLVRRDGAASLLDGADRRTVVWSRRDLLDRVYGVTRGGGLVHLHGGGVDEKGDKVGRVVSIDPSSGRIVLDVEVPVGEVQWLVAGDLGRIAIGTRSEVRLLDPVGALLGGGDRWTRRESNLGGGVVGWMTDSDLAVADDSGRISAWDLAGGRGVADRWLLPEGDDLGIGRAVETLDLTDRHLLHLDGRLVLHDADGRLIGADALDVPGRRDWKVLRVEDGLLLLTRIPIGAGGTTLRIQRLDPAAGLRLAGSPFEIAGRTRFEDVRAVDGHLLLSTEDETHVVPMSHPRDVAPDFDAGP